MKERELTGRLESEKTFFLNELGEVILHNIGFLKQLPKWVGMHSEGVEHEEELNYLRDYLERGLVERYLPEVRPQVLVMPPPDLQFTVNLGHFLKSGSLPSKFTPPNERGKEEYYPTEGEKILGYIVHGSVVDHIPDGRVFGLRELLHLERFSGRLSIGDHYWSKRMGRKGILKLEGHHFDEEERGVILEYAPESSISLISAGKQYRKYRAA